MITLAWYLLKVIICSGILCGYYFLALRNKAFHRWNRFYLLAAVVISLVAPVIKINIFQNNKDEGTVVQMLQTISYGDEAVIEYSRNSGFQISTENLAEASYLLVSMIFLLIFLVSIYKIKKIKKKYPETKIEDIRFINTSEKGTPFSFFKSIFWNNAIDLHSRSGQQIFNHEIAHVKERHSYDKIFMNLVLIFFWINPIFWLMRKELYMIHEFIADKEALEDSDVNTFAEMILQTVYPGQNFSAVNSFFYSPLKRRIMMLTKNKNPKVSYYSRLLVLPLAAIVFFAFTLKVKNNNVNFYDGKTITVVIDAGHGGDDNGAHSANGLKEKDITLSIAKKIAALNSNEHINILLSRDNDQSIAVRDRVHFAKDHNADLFISIHVNAAVDEQLNGFSVLIDRNNTKKNQLLASALINELKTSYKTEDVIAIRNKGLVVVDSNSCPAAVVECGYMTNPDDVAFISKDANQEKIAKDILVAINNYAIAQENNESETLSGKPAIKDSIPTGTLLFADGKEISKSEMENISPQNIESINVLKDEKAINKYGEKGKNGVIEISTKKVTYSVSGNTDTLYMSGSSSMPFSENMKMNANVVYINSKIPEGVIIFADGKEISKDEMKNIPPNKIGSINILKGGTGIKKYGEKAKDGVIEITTKNNIPENTSIIIDGKESTRENLEKIEPGNIESITILKDDSSVKKYGMPPRAVIKIKTKKNLPSVSSQPKVENKSTTKIDGKRDMMIFTKLEPASFPGGQPGWLKYISRVIQKNGNELIADKNSEGTCKVRFIVDRDGKVSDVRAVTKQGSKLADVAVNAIKNGPRWIPGKRNGHIVNSYLIQPVTFALNDNVALKNEPE